MYRDNNILDVIKNGRWHWDEIFKTRFFSQCRNKIRYRRQRIGWKDVAKITWNRGPI